MSDPKGHGFQIDSENPYHRQLANRLYSAGKIAAKDAVLHFLSEDYERKLSAALSCGLATEYLLKSAIARKDLLLISSQDLDSRIAFSGANLGNKLLSSQVRTAQWRDLVKITERLYPKIEFSAHLEKVFQVRNAAAHLALVDSSELSEAILELITFVSSILAETGEFEEIYWGTEVFEHVQHIKANAHDVIVNSISAKKTIASACLNAKRADFDKDTWEKFALGLEENLSREVSDDKYSFAQSETCPLCGYSGLTSFHIYDGEKPELKFADDQNFHRFPYLLRLLYPIADEFKCSVCQLKLTYDEMALLGMKVEAEPIEEVLDDDPYMYEEEY